MKLTAQSRECRAVSPSARDDDRITFCCGVGAPASAGIPLCREEMKTSAHDICSTRTCRVQPSNEDHSTFGTFLAEVWSERLVFSAAFALLVVIGAVLLVNLTPQYRAEALVLIDPRQTRVVEQSAVVEPQHIDASAVQTEAEIVRSPRTLGAVVRTLRLEDDPEFVKPPALGPIKALHRLRESLWGGDPHDETLDPGSAAGDPPPWSPEKAATVALANHVAAMPVGRSYLVSITARSYDPEKAAEIANAVAEQYVQNRLEDKVARAQGASILIQSRLEELRAKLFRAQVATAKFKARHGLVESLSAAGTTTPILRQEIADSNAQLLVAQTERIVLESKISQMETGGTDIPKTTDVLSSPLVQQLRSHEGALIRKEAELATEYQSNHPKMREARNELAALRNQIHLKISEIYDALKNDLSIVREKERLLESRLEILKARMSDEAAAQAQLSKLEQDVRSSETLYNTFLERFKGTAEQRHLEQSDTAVVSAATAPLKPATPRTWLVLAGILGAASSGSVLAALGRSRLRRGFLSALKLRSALGTPQVAVVPHVSARQRHQVREHNGLRIVTARLPFFSETVSNVNFVICGLAPPKIVLFTSSVPKEGKTFLAASVALQLARTGKSTLYIDCDLYKGENRTISHADGALPGLSDCLSGTAKWREIVVTTGVGIPDAILHGRRTADPTSALASSEFACLLEQVREAYEFVVLDGPPVLATSGARFLTALADRVVFVVRWAKTPRTIVHAAYEELACSGAEICASVLTHADLRKMRKTGYGGPGTYYAGYSQVGRRLGPEARAH